MTDFLGLVREPLGGCNDYVASLAVDRATVESMRRSLLEQHAP